MAKIKYNTDILQKTPQETGPLTFLEIGAVLNISELEAEKIFNRAMKKLGSPKLARKIWEYDNIGATPEAGSEIAGVRL